MDCSVLLIKSCLRLKVVAFNKMFHQCLQDKNASLNDSLNDLSTKIDSMESREQKFHTALQLKEKNICETTHYAASLQRKIGALEAQIQENKRKEDMTQSDLKYERTRYNNIKSENECLKRWYILYQVCNYCYHC